MKRTELSLAVVAIAALLGVGAAWLALRDDAAPDDAAALVPRTMPAAPRTPEPERTQELAAPPAPTVAPAAAASEDPAPVAAAAPVEPVRTELVPRTGALVAGSVVDGDGRPLVDVRVEVRLPAAGHGLAHALSDATGAFAIALELADHVQERARRARRGQRSDEFLIALRDLGYDVDDDTPVAFARADASLARHRAELLGRDRPARAVRLELEVRASAPGFVPDDAVVALGPTEERRGIELVLAEGGFAVGRVDVPFAEVWLLETNGVVRSTARADGRGEYVLGFPASGLYHVFAKHPRAGHAWHTGLSLSTIGPAAIAPLALRGRESIPGHVVYPDGRPATGVLVEAAPLELVGLSEEQRPWGPPVARALAELRYFHGEAWTNERSVFLVDGLHPGRYRLTLPEVVHGTPPSVETQTGERVELVWDGARLLVGVVLAGDDEGAIEVRCVLESENDLATSPTALRTIPRRSGTVAFDVLPGGKYRVSARGPGGAMTERTVLVIGSEEHVELVLVPGRELVLDDRDGGDGRMPQAMLRVEMIDVDAERHNRRAAARGEPTLATVVRGLLLTLRDAEDEAAVEAWPIERGWLATPPGTWRVELSPGDGYWIPDEVGPSPLELAPGEVRTLTLHGRQGGRIALDVDRPGDLAGEPLRVVAVDAQNTGHELALDAQGRLDPLPPGDFTLHVTSASTEPWEKEVRVVAHETVKLEVALRGESAAVDRR